MKSAAPGQVRKTEDNGFYLVLCQSEKPGVWFIAPDYGGIESWWLEVINEFR